MFAFQTDIDLETGIDLQRITETAVEAVEADDMINGGYNNDDNATQSADETEDVANNEGNENDSSLFIYQRSFNPNEKADGMYSLESEDQDTLKEDSEGTTVANEDNDRDEPDVESRQGQEPSEAELEELEDQEADVGTNDENNNDNEFDPELIDEESAIDEIKALTNDIEEEVDVEVMVYGFFLKQTKKYNWKISLFGVFLFFWIFHSLFDFLIL